VIRELFWDPATPKYYWKVKGIGRIVLLAGIAIYGVGLLLLRMEIEGENARASDTDDDTA